MAVADLRAAASARPGRRVVDGRYICRCRACSARLAPRDRLLHRDDLRLAEIGAGLAHAADAALLPAVCRLRRLLLRPAFFALAGGHRAMLLAAGAIVVLRRRLDRQARLAQQAESPAPALDARNRDRARPDRQGAAVRAAAHQRQLPDPRNGLQVARKHADKLSRIALAAAAASCRSLLLARRCYRVSGARTGCALAARCCALLSHVAGMLVERWLFFAEARHAVMNYYGELFGGCQSVACASAASAIAALASMTSPTHAACVTCRLQSSRWTLTSEHAACQRFSAALAARRR